MYREEDTARQRERDRDKGEGMKGRGGRQWGSDRQEGSSSGKRHQRLEARPEQESKNRNVKDLLNWSRGSAAEAMRDKMYLTWENLFRFVFEKNIHNYIAMNETEKKLYFVLK